MPASLISHSPTTRDREKAAIPPPVSSLEKKELISNTVPTPNNNTVASPLDQTPPYSIFNKTQKRAIIWQTSFSAMFSGLSSFMYYPTITALSNSLHVSVAAINITVAAYLIVAGIAPSVLGDISDQTGRRPVSLLALTLFFAANIGLALQNRYAVLVALRCLQSAGSAGTIAIAHGVISDITSPAERGSYVGVLFGFTNTAPSLGPLLGGVITQQLSWRWVFWLLTILSGCQLMGLWITFPETSRKLVDNGSIVPPCWLNRSLFSIYKARKKKQQLRIQQSPLFPPSNRNSRFIGYIPNPFTCLSTFFQKATSIVILVGSIQYTVYSVLGTSISTEMASIYDLNSLATGLLYLPSGIGGLIASLQTGKLLDYNYKIVVRALELSASTVSSNCNSTVAPVPVPVSVPVHSPLPGPFSPPSPNDLTAFPIERARLRIIVPFLLIASFSTLGYGWSLHFRTSIVVPLLMQFLSGSTQVAIFVICGTLLTDLNPGRSSTAQAAYSVVRCGMAAGGVAALGPVVESVGIGWCFTGATGLSVLCAPLLAGLWAWGWDWRKKSRKRDDEEVRS